MKKLLLLFVSIISIHSFSQITATVSYTVDPICLGDLSGEAMINVTGGTPPYVFTLSPNVGFQNPINTNNMLFQGLMSGTYTVDIIDDVGATDQVTFTLMDPPPIMPFFTVSDDTCSTCTGSIQVFTGGGTAPYTFSIDGGATNTGASLFSGLCEGAYQILVTDANGCIDGQSAIVANTNSWGGSAIGVAATSPAYCNDGSIALSITSGIAPFEVLWNTGDTLFLLNNVGPGTYTASVTDSAGCTVDIQGIVIDSSALAGCSTISGNVFSDDNNNCVDDAELGLPSMVIKANPGNYVGIADANGDYTLNLPYGAYTVTQFLPNNIVNNCTPSYAVTTSVSNQTSTANDFADSVNVDFATNLFLSLIRPIMSTTQVLYTSNNSLISDDATIYYVPDPSFIVSATTPAFDSQNGDTLFWNNVTIPTFSTNSITITGTTSSGVSSVLTFCHGVLPNNGDSDYSNNELCNDITVTGSYDPNDKQVFPAGDIYLTDQILKYQIRFQNTGNDTAFTVIIIDTLSMKLDPATFQFIGASHNCIPEIINNNILKFTFPNILLPDSTTNEILSHGHVLFEINQSTSNQIGDVIENTVGIYFDYNEPVITNTATSPIVQDFTSVSEFTLNELNIYPNPANNQFSVDLGETIQSEVRIVDALGKVVYSSSNNGKSTIQINSSNWNAGIYMIQVISGSEIYNGKVVID